MAISSLIIVEKKDAVNGGLTILYFLNLFQGKIVKTSND